MRDQMEWRLSKATLKVLCVYLDVPTLMYATDTLRLYGITIRLVDIDEILLVMVV